MFNSNTSKIHSPRIPEITEVFANISPVLIRVVDGNYQRIGLQDKDGKKYPFLAGESYDSVSEETGEPRIKTKDGTILELPDWIAQKKADNSAKMREVDDVYADIYEDLVEEYPHLSMIDLELAGPDTYRSLKGTAGFWRKPTEDNPFPAMVVDIKQGEEKFRKLLEIREISARMAAESIGISFEELKQRPDILGLFIFFHELGHLDDYTLNYFLNEDVTDPVAANQSVQDSEINSLPVTVGPGYLTSLTSQELDELYAKHEQYFLGRKINSPAELIAQNEYQYHMLPKEKHADDFAARVLQKHAEKLGISIIE